MSERWHLKGRGSVTATHELGVTSSRCHSSLFPSAGTGSVVCSIFRSGGSRDERQKTQAVSGHPVVPLTGHEKGQQPPPQPPLHPTHTHTHGHSFPLTGVEDRHGRGSGTATVTEQRLARMVSCVTNNVPLDHRGGRHLLRVGLLFYCRYKSLYYRFQIITIKD